MAVSNIRRGGAPSQVGRPNANSIRVDSTDDVLVFGTGASGTTEKTAVDLSSTQTISGTKTFTGTVVMSGAVTKTEFADGTVSLPSITFSDDLNSGIYRIGTDNVGVAVNGAKVVDVATTGATVTGTVSATGTTPIIATVTGQTNTGYLSLTGKTSGSLKVLPADAMAQVVTIAPAAQTSGASTLTIPDQAGVSSDFVFTTLAQSLSNKTLASPVINTPAGATSTGVMITKRVLFTENATNTTHTGTVVVPAGAWIHDICVTNQALWGAAAASLVVGDTADPDGYFTGVDCKATDLAVGELLSVRGGSIDTDGLWGGKQGAYLVAATGRVGPTSDNFSLYYAAGSSIIGVMTVTTPSVTTGRTILSVTYSVGEAIAAVPTGP